MTSFPERIHVTPELASRLIAAQFPAFAHLPVTNVAHSGWDNRTFRLGDDLLIRIPSAEWYVAQVEREQRWLPYLAPHLPLPIPAPIAQGEPGEGYPFPWSIYRWLPGEPLVSADVPDRDRFARDLAGFLSALYRINPTDGPPAGIDSFYRGSSPRVYDAQTRESIAALAGEIDAHHALAIWEAAISSEWSGPDTWFHGDVAVGNLLVQDDALSGVIDFGTFGVGDPACDTVIAWTWFTGRSRAIFAEHLDVEPGAWMRGRGWALWKCLITLLDTNNTTLPAAGEQRRILTEILIDPICGR